VEPAALEAVDETSGGVVCIYNSSTSGPVSDISDAELDQLMHHILKIFPNFGRHQTDSLDALANIEWQKGDYSISSMHTSLGGCPESLRICSGRPEHFVLKPCAGTISEILNTPSLSASGLENFLNFVVFLAVKWTVLS
jgi:hypothetical protein